MLSILWNLCRLLAHIQDVFYLLCLGLQNETYQEYHTNPNNHVTIHYHMGEDDTPGNQYMTKEMKDVCNGIFVMEFVVFYGEEIHYYITEESDGEQTITESAGLTLDDEDAVKVELSKTHKILLHVTGSIIKMDQNSPYSFDNPIRKIDSMEVIIQPEDGLCGQTCVAMLAGVTIAEVIRVMDCREWQATMGRVISALNYYGIDHSDVIVYTEGKDAVLPKCCIMMEKMGRFCHYLVHYDGKFYDSNLGVMEEYDMSKLLGYLEIKC